MGEGHSSSHRQGAQAQDRYRKCSEGCEQIRFKRQYHQWKLVLESRPNSQIMFESIFLEGVFGLLAEKIELNAKREIVSNRMARNN